MPNEIETKVFERVRDEILIRGFSEDEVEKIMNLIIVGDKRLSNGINEVLGVKDEDH